MLTWKGVHTYNQIRSCVSLSTPVPPIWSPNGRENPNQREDLKGRVRSRLRVLWVFDCYMRSEEGVGFGYFECLIAEFVFSTVLYLRRCTLTLRHQHTFCPGCSLCVTIPRTCAISAVRDSQRLLHKLSQLLDLQKVTPRVLKCGD